MITSPKEAIELVTVSGLKDAKIETMEILKEKHELEIRIVDTVFQIALYESRGHADDMMEKAGRQLICMLKYKEAIERRLDFVFKDD